MAENPYKAPSEPSEHRPREYARWVHYLAACAVVAPAGIAYLFAQVAYDRWEATAFSRFTSIDLLIYAAFFAVAAAVVTVFVARLLRG